LHKYIRCNVVIKGRYRNDRIKIIYKIILHSDIQWLQKVFVQRRFLKKNLILERERERERERVEN